MSGPLIMTTRSVDETLALGVSVGRSLVGGDFVALCGPLGAGKTQFVKGIARGLETPADEPIISPTFVLMREYQGRLKLHHLDLYRLAGDEDAAELGIEELRTAGDAVVVVEWAERAPRLIPPGAWRVKFEHCGPDERRLEIVHPDPARLGRIGV